MHQRARRNVALGLADGPAIFADRAACGKRTQRYFVSARDQLPHFERARARLAQIEDFAGLERSYGNCNIVSGVDAMKGAARGGEIRLHGKPVSLKAA